MVLQRLITFPKLVLLSGKVHSAVHEIQGRDMEEKCTEDLIWMHAKCLGVNVDLDDGEWVSTNAILQILDELKY